MKIKIVKNSAQGKVVTAGIPIARNILRDTKLLRIIDSSNRELSIFVKATMFWPDGSIKSLKAQWNHDGETSVTALFLDRNTTDIAEQKIEEIVSTAPKRAPYKEPAFLCIHEPSYVVATGIIPPTTIAGNSDFDTKWYPTFFTKHAEVMPFKWEDIAPSRGTESERKDLYKAAWLFDSASSVYEQAIRSGNAEQYKEAYLQHEHYIAQFDVTNATTVGRWLTPIAGDDIKYVYLTPLKLHLALTGDDSWTPQENAGSLPVNAKAKDRNTFFKTIAEKAGPIQGINSPYTNIAVRFTERETGFALQQIIAAYELTNEPALLTFLNNAINNLYNMMTNNPDGRGDHGYLSHSWDAHEGDVGAYIGVYANPLPATPTAFSELVLKNGLADDYKKLTAGSKIFFKIAGMATLKEAATKNADGTITLKFTTPVTLSTTSTDWQPMFSSNSVGATRNNNFASDRAFSPWMQSVIADGLWQLYNLITDEDQKAQISKMLLGFGRAITAYALDAKQLDAGLKSQIEKAFGVSIASGDPCCGKGIAPYTQYAATNLTSGAPGTFVQALNADGDFSDQHTPEALFQVSLAIRFETDPAKKAAMQSLAALYSQWFAAANVGRTIAPDPERVFNWANKPNPWGTYQYVLNGPSEPPVEPPIDPPVEPPIPPTDPDGVAALKLKIALLEKQVEILNQEVERLTNANKALQADKAYLVDRNKALSEELVLADAENASLQAEIATITAKVEESNARLESLKITI